jgi:hypothetical protein
MITKNPIACAVAEAAQNKAVRRAGKSGVTAGCNWVVKQVGNSVSIKVEGPPDKAGEIKKAYEEFEKAKKAFTDLLHKPPSKTKK